ncbi:McrC family protein [Sphingomonas sp.]|uniref:McrC family protein n=1 Tax=Sphingomonas sp. TaxID=28214 RepID=UPI0035C821AD
MIARTLDEWAHLPHGHGEGEIAEPLAVRLAAVAAASPLSGRGGEGVLEHRRKGLRARGVVGVVVAEGATLEILPKIDGAGDHGGVRRRLVHMLAVALDMKVEAGEIAHHDEQKETLLEILIRLFTTRLADAVRRGMPRRYIAHEEDLPALRGRLDVMRQFTTLAASPHRLACRYDALSPDVALNRIMKAAVTRLRRIARAGDNQRRLAELAFAYADIADVPASALRWDEVVIDRTNERWRALVDLARLLLGERFQTTSSGGGQGFSLLFEMNTLFEEYVARMLARSLAGTGARVVAQGGRLFCLEREGKGVFQTRPDILVKRGDTVEQVIDTKWKRVAARVDDTKQGVAQADVYQMMAYARLYACPRVTLLYPHHEKLGAMPLAEAYRINLPGCDERVEVATVDMGTAAGMRERLRAMCGVSSSQFETST